MDWAGGFVGRPRGGQGRIGRIGKRPPYGRLNLWIGNVTPYGVLFREAWQR